jgi:hypothetical protein
MDAEKSQNEHSSNELQKGQEEIYLLTEEEQAHVIAGNNPPHPFTPINCAAKYLPHNQNGYKECMNQEKKCLPLIVNPFEYNKCMANTCVIGAYSGVYS